MVVLVALALLLAALDRQVFSALAPLITSDLNISDARYGLLAAAFPLAHVLSAPSFGVWAGRGPRLVLPFAVIAWSVVIGLHGAAGSFLGLLLARLCLGIAEAPVVPAAFALMRSGWPASRRALGVGILLCGSSLGALLAPGIGLRAAEAWGVPGSFLLVATLGFAWLVAWVVIPLPADAPAPAIPSRMRTRDVMGEPVVRANLAGVLAAAVVLGVALAWAAKYMVTFHHLSAHELPRYLWLPPLAFDLGAVFAGLLLTRYTKARRVVAAFGTVAAMGLMASPFAPSPSWGISAWALSCAGAGALIAATIATVLNALPREAAASVGGLFVAFNGTVQALVGVGFGALVQWQGYPLALGISSILSASLAAIWFLSMMGERGAAEGVTRAG